MAYFKQNEPEETRRNEVLSPGQVFEPGDYDPPPQGAGYGGGEYDDGLEDDLSEDEYEYELTEEEKQERRKNRIQILFGAGDLTAIVVGALVILLLLTLLFSLISFVRTDFVRNFTLFQTKL